MKKKMEFSQKFASCIVVFSMFIVFVAVCLNFTLLWFGKESMSQETIAAISTYGGITATAGMVVYGALTGWRCHSKNATGITHGELGIPGPYDNIGDCDHENQLEAETFQP